MFLWKNLSTLHCKFHNNWHFRAVEKVGTRDCGSAVVEPLTHDLKFEGSNPVAFTINM
jgi:hypothetical protein